MIKIKQIALVIGLFSVAFGLLYYSLTWTEEERLILTDASLKGKVTYKGKPIPFALVILTSNGYSATGAADEYGNFFVEHSPIGEVSVGVNTEAAKGMMMSARMAAAQSPKGSAEPPPPPVDIPKKFFAPETSGVFVRIDDAKNTTERDIELK